MAIHQYDIKISQEVAEHLLEVEALKIRPEDPFTWASGWKSPIYCDNRLSLSFPKVRTLVKDRLIQTIRDKYPQAECIAGVATAGIPQGILIAEAMGLPFIYIRSKSKEHGMGNQIEGKAVPGQKVVVIEDLVSTGGSSLQAAEAIRVAKMEVLGMVAIFTYGFGIAEENFREHHIDLWYLSDYQTLIATLIEKGAIKPELEATLSSWRSNPAQWNQ